jgi:hypothetical protein
MNDPSEKAPIPAIPFPTGAILRGFTGTDGQSSQQAQPGGETSFDAVVLPNQGFFSLLSAIVLANFKALPQRLKKDIYWLGPLVLMWLILWPLKVMTLLQMPSALHSLVMALIFLTATYNGFVGKAVFITVLSRTIIPAIQQIKAGKSAEIRDRLARTIKLLKGIIAKGKKLSLKLILISGGFGLIASNILTRNNKIDKYLVCLLAALALINDLSKGTGNPVVRLVSTGLRDLPLLAGKSFKVSLQSTYVMIAGFALGLTLAFLPGLMAQSYNSPVGLVTGLIVLAAGLVLHFTGGKNASK